MPFLPPGLNIDPSLLPFPPAASATAMIPTHTSDPQLYKNYLHKLPHLAFKVSNSTPSSLCTACDCSTPFEYYICTTCGLQLCGGCQHLMTNCLIRGDLKRLIQHTARWKLGYSRAFLERERMEYEREWREEQEAWEEREKLVREERESQKEISRLFERMFLDLEADKGVKGLGLISESGGSRGGCGIVEGDAG